MLVVLMIAYAKYGIAAAVVLIIFFAGFKQGSARVQSRWDKSENAALTQQQNLRIQAEKERDLANSILLDKQIALENAELEAQRFNDELQIAINREPVVTTVSVSTSDDCPVVQCNIPDAGSHFRLFNCAINNSCETLSPADQASLSDGTMPRPDSLASMDGIYGSVIKDFTF